MAPDRPGHRIDLGTGWLEIRYQEPLGAAAFGSHAVRFYLCDEGQERLLAASSLSNDGANPGSQNLEVTDRGNGRWIVTLKGAEQADERWLVDTDRGPVRMEKLH